MVRYTSEQRVFLKAPMRNTNLLESVGRNSDVNFVMMKALLADELFTIS
jgi:hypothetical protein